jgi:bifunctional non-homologous end joining protein LigD
MRFLGRPRLMVALRAADRLFSRNGHEWTERFPRIREALAAFQARSVPIDGEAVVCWPRRRATD